MTFRVSEQNTGLASSTSRPQVPARTISSPRGQFEEGLARYSLSLDDEASPTSQVSEAARRRSIEELRTLARAVQLGERDPERLADLIFFARHPDLLDLPPEAYD